MATGVECVYSRQGGCRPLVEVADYRVTAAVSRSTPPILNGRSRTCRPRSHGWRRNTPTVSRCSPGRTTCAAGAAEIEAASA